MRKTNLLKSLLTVALVFSLLVEILLPCFPVLAADSYVYAGGAGTAVSDRDTSTLYSLSLGDNASTEYAGRIWTDKSVFAGNATFATFGGGSQTIKLNEANNGEDFLIAYSALASSQAISGSTQAPVDVVFVIDLSGSMSNASSGMDNNLSRIANTVTALNTAIEEVMAMNDHARVAVVGFSSTATTLLPLGRYSKLTQREWVDPDGRGPQQGSYQNVTHEFFSLSNERPSSNNSTLYINAVGDDDTVESSISVSGGTNIQVGLNQGFSILANADSTSANINGSNIPRVPSVVLLSDGAPTYSSSSSSWWNPSNNDDDGAGTNPSGSNYFIGNGFKALLTGAYMKQVVSRKYGMNATLYSIGMGISNLSGAEKDLAYVTIDPAQHWDDSSNAVAVDMKAAWNTYLAGGTPSVNVGERQGYNGFDDDYYTVTHPSSNDISGDALKKLVDDYYDADNASAVTSVFDQIVSSISISAPQVPTEIKGGMSVTESGYITYTDPIGEYMEIKDVKAILYAGELFTAKSVSTTGNVTTYVFSGAVHSPVYGDQNIDDIQITVTESAGKQTLVIKIPASVIPLRINTVELNEDSTVKSHTNNGAFPARVIYSVGLQSEILKESDNGTVYVDTTKLSAEYLSANTNADGSVNFFSNLYTNMHEINGFTVGDTMVDFEPSHTNPFYYILEDMPIYKDAALTQQLSAAETLSPTATYYYRSTFYHGASIEVKAAARTGEQLLKTEIKEVDGYLYRAAGSPHLNRILLFEGTKVANATGTAEDFYAPEFRYAEGSTSAYDGRFTVHLGNNGKLSLAAGGNLQISKDVAAAPGLTAPDKSFEFNLDLDGSNVNQGEYFYDIVNAAGTQVATGHVSKNNTKIVLKDGQTATVYALPPATTYTVTETNAAGFATQSNGATGTIVAGQTSVATFTNTYNVTPVSWPYNDTFKGQKVLAGREWAANDAFTFLLTPYGNEPLPDGYDPSTGITVTAPDAVNGQVATFSFGDLTFNAPGTYRYIIDEKEPENNAYLPGVSYSSATYRLVIVVEDNGDGTLAVTSSDLQRLYDDEANQLFTYVNNEIVMNSGEEAQDSIVFTNTYSAGSVTRVPVALKDYTDNSGEHPLESGMFTFEFKALGIVENGVLVDTDVSKVPMPQGSVNGVITTTNEGHNITFPSVEFTQSVIPQNAASITFRYQMREVAPSTPVNGMTYDDTVYTIDVIVAIDPNSHLLDVQSIYPNNERIVTFRNTYTPNPVSTDIDVSKTLIGRDMVSGEAFEFVLGANAATSNAIRNGIVVVPSSTMTVSGARDGVKTEFAFKDILFKKSGTYVFTVSETPGAAPAVVYDGTVYTVTVVVNDADGDGNLNIASVTYSNGKTAADFVNTYSATFDGTPVSLSATKNLTGKSLLAGEFYFEVAEYFNGAFVKDYLVTHTEDTAATNGVYTGTIDILKDVTYTEAGQYIYYISEQIPATPVGGTDYDENRFRYVVTVEDVDKVGKLTVTSKSLQKLNGNLWENANDVLFTNTYTPAPTTLTLPLIKKLLSGYRAEALQAGEFQFVLSAVSSTTNGGMQLPAVTTVGNAANGDIVFDPITFTKAGTYVVSIKEVIPANPLPGVTYSTQEMTAVIEVADDRNGTLTAVLTQYLGGDTFVNLYEADSTEVTISITKDFTGRENNAWLATDVFDFEIVVLDPDTAAAIENGDLEFPTDSSTGGIVRKSIDSTTPDKTVSGTIRVNTPGTYKFIVRELTGTIPGIHYDSAPREVTLIATDDTANAKITVKVLIDGAETTAMTFRNVYDTQYTEISGHDHLTIEKIFTGRENDLWLDSDRFVFTLEAHDTVTRNAVTAGDIELPATSITISNANKAHPHFGNILFHTAGTYTFKVTEMPSGIAGVTDDADTDRIVIVQVTDNNQGALVATIAQGSEELKFTNTYSATPITLVGSTNLTISKNLIGRNWLASDSFGFTIAPSDGATQAAVNAGDIVMPATGITITAQAGHSGAVDGHFGDIVFKKAGAYQFIITETAGNTDKISYSTNHYYVVVTVTDNNQGALVATPTYHGTSIFENTYSPESVRAVFRGMKTLLGKLDLAADNFTFVISALTDGAPMPAETTATNAADGSISFGEIWFNAAGVYKYKIQEVAGSIPGVTYDTDAVTATVTVTYDENTGYFSIATVYTKENTQGETATFAFENEYKAAASAPVSLQAQKVVTPSAGNSYTLIGGEFQFKIEAIGNAPMPTTPTATNNSQGIIDFGSVQFTEEGTYKYTVYEVLGSKTGFTYDEAKYTITVEVTDVVALAKLVTNVKITDMAGADASIIFDNKYAPKDTSVTIFGSKELQGGHKQLAADEFHFSIQAVTSGAPLPAELTVKNAADGTFRFDSITYTKVGNYVYQITEKDLGADGYTYDSTVYTVLVTVTDEDGQLKAAVEGLGTELAPVIAFVNKYVPQSVTAILGAQGELQKELGGRDLAAEEFIFALLDSEGHEIATTKNTADGAFQFSVDFTKAGTYLYTMKEKDNDVPGVTYDATVYNVEIVIVDENGHLKVDSVTYTKENDEVDEVVFTNTYEAADADIQISATKNLTGRDLVDGEFKFVLVDKDGNTIATATNTADGKIVFDKIVVSQVGTYTFTVLEETGTLDYVTYDKTQFQVVVEVTDDGKGQLQVSTPVIKKVGDDNAVAEIVFENTYVVPVPDNPQTGDNTRISLWVTIMCISAAGLVGTMLYEMSAKRAMKAQITDEEE